MISTPIDFVTISREFGSGGSEFAQALGARLGWPVLDRDVVYRVAERLALDAAVVERLDESPPSRLARLAAAMHVLPPEMPSSYVAYENQLRPDDVAHTTHAVIAEAVRNPPLIVVGHGTQCAFADRPGTFHVRIVAPLDARARRLTPRLGCDPGRATTDAQRVDGDRGRYVQRYYQRDWRDPLLYDLQLNTGRIAVDEAAELVARLIVGSRAGTADARH